MSINVMPSSDSVVDLPVDLPAKRQLAIDVLRAAARKLDGHWCVGDLYMPGYDEKPDKFCAVGVLASMQNPTLINDDYMNDFAYAEVANSDAGKALAVLVAERVFNLNDIGEQIRAAGYCRTKYKTVEGFLSECFVSEIIFNYNDAQESSEAVIRMMNEAADRLEAGTINLDLEFLGE